VLGATSMWCGRGCAWAPHTLQHTGERASDSQALCSA
jgi:hypothetical protein